MRGNRSCPTLLHKQTKILHPELIQYRIAVEESQANPTHAVVSNASTSRWKSVRTWVNYGYRQSTGNYYQHIITCRGTLPLNSSLHLHHRERQGLENWHRQEWYHWSKSHRDIKYLSLPCCIWYKGSPLASWLNRDDHSCKLVEGEEFCWFYFAGWVILDSNDKKIKSKNEIGPVQPSNAIFQTSDW